MTALIRDTCMDLDRETLRQCFDREPFGFTHSLCGLDLFAFESLRSLAAKYTRDYFVAAGAPSPASEFYSVAHGHCGPVEAMDLLDSGSYRILLKHRRSRPALSPAHRHAVPPICRFAGRPGEPEGHAASGVDLDQFCRDHDTLPF